jgi:hypothetical protein
VFFKKEDSKYHFVGYLMDISEGGARFFLDKLDDLNISAGKHFRVLIKPEEKVVPPCSIPVETSWFKEWNSEDTTWEMGVRFCDLGEKEQQYIQYLIELFARNSGMDVRTEIQD